MPDLTIHIKRWLIMIVLISVLLLPGCQPAMPTFKPTTTPVSSSTIVVETKISMPITEKTFLATTFSPVTTPDNSNKNPLLLIKTLKTYGPDFTISPNGKKIVASFSDSVLAFDINNEEISSVLNKPNSSLMGGGPVAFSPDGKTLAAEVNVEGANGTKSEIYLLDTTAFNLIRKFEYNKLLVDIQFSPDGKLIAGTGESGSIYVWDIKDGKETHLNSYANHFAFSSVDPLLASGELVGLSGPAVILWNTKDFTSKGIFDLEPNLNSAYSGVTTSVSFSPDGRLLAAVVNGKLRFWDVAANKEIESPFTTSGSLVKAIYSNKGYLATLDQKGEITVYDSNSGNVLGTLVIKDVDDPIYFETAFAMMFSPDGKQLITGAYDIPIQIWDIP
jgi:WD40 repeat protein